MTISLNTMFFIATTLITSCAQAEFFDDFLISLFFEEQPKQPSLTDVTKKVTMRLRSKVNKGKIVDEGRINLLKDMELEPHQLTVDLPRIQHIFIGKQKISNSFRNNKSPYEQYALLTTLLKKYVREQFPDLPVARGAQIGFFYADEIIFASSQTFIATAQSEAYKSDPFLATGEWGGLSGVGNMELSFSFEKVDAPILVVSQKVEKLIRHVSENRQEKYFVSMAFIKFHLDTGKVTFHHFYSVAGAGKSWCTNASI